MAGQGATARLGLPAPLAFLREENGLLAGAAVTVAAFLLAGQLQANMGAVLIAVPAFVIVFGVMLWCAFGVVRHADSLAVLLGEPYGTLILTLAVIGIEVALIAALMLTGKSAPTTARDTMMSVLMIVLCGMVGLTLLLGGLRHLEQSHNLQGATAFLSVLVPLSVLTLILPRYTTTTADPTFSSVQAVFFSLASIGLYGIFLAIQTLRHGDFFRPPPASFSTATRHSPTQAEDSSVSHDHGDLVLRPALWHGAMLLLTMLPIILLSKTLALFVDFGVSELQAPAALGGLLVAVLVLTPEGLGAVKAALGDHIQRSVNICLGSALATIGLTVPAVLVIGLVTGQDVVLGLQPAKELLLVLTLGVSLITFLSGRTNMLSGAVHLVLFAVYIVLIFDTPGVTPAVPPAAGGG
ncbi:MAG: hypothetical protein RIB84_23090 [Sneathiellaceae bacterium]